MDLETEKFTYYLDECYFHSERDKEFSTKTEKQLARYNILVKIPLSISAITSNTLPYIIHQLCCFIYFVI